MIPLVFSSTVLKWFSYVARHYIGLVEFDGFRKLYAENE